MAQWVAGHFAADRLSSVSKGMPEIAAFASDLTLAKTVTALLMIID